MSDKQYHRLLFSFIMSVVMIGIVIVLLVMILNKPKDVQVYNYVGEQGIIGKDGRNGNDGYTPVLGKDFFNGKDSLSTNTVVEKYFTSEIIKEKPIEVPVKGDKGDSGRMQIIYIDYDNCVLMSKYEGDRTGQELAQLPKPCEVSNE